MFQPRNIFLDESLHVKLGDFGLARENLSVSGDPITPAEELRGSAFDRHNISSTSGVGTQSYASPEQLNSSRIDNKVRHVSYVPRSNVR